MTTVNYSFKKQSVTLGDEEAKKRKVQKTILERKGPSTFTCAVELISKYECRVHHRLDATVDAILAGTTLCNRKFLGLSLSKFVVLVKSYTFCHFCVTGKSPLFEIRKMDAGSNDSQKAIPMSKIICSEKSDLANDKERDTESDEEVEEQSPSHSKKSSSGRSVNKRTSPVRIYAYKVILVKHLNFSI